MYDVLKIPNLWTSVWVKGAGCIRPSVPTAAQEGWAPKKQKQFKQKIRW